MYEYFGYHTPKSFNCYPLKLESKLSLPTFKDSASLSGTVIAFPAYTGMSNGNIELLIDGPWYS